MYSEIASKFGNRLRVRVCGLCWEGRNLLLANHKSLALNDFWSPPGGGIEFGQTASAALKQEILEETGLTIRVGKLLFVCEFIRNPLHAVELFFEVFYEKGVLRTGFDPELLENQQIITEVKFLSPEEVKGLPRASLHGVFSYCNDLEGLKKLTGYIKI